jgi:hypothetical protein
LAQWLPREMNLHLQETRHSMFLRAATWALTPREALTRAPQEALTQAPQEALTSAPRSS